MKKNNLKLHTNLNTQTKPTVKAFAASVQRLERARTPKAFSRALGELLLNGFVWGSSGSGHAFYDSIYTQLSKGE